jgi:hypothetical protein
MIFNSTLMGQTGKISGYVYNGSADSTVIANAEVNLLVYRGHNVVDDSSYVVTTNKRGSFEFTSLKLDTTLIYYPRSTFKTIVYYGNAVRLTDKASEAKTDLVVYDTTSSAEKIAIQLEHLFIDAEPGKMFFREIFIINNMGDKTFIGKHFDQPNRHYVLKFPLPEKFEDVEILTPEAQSWVKLDGNTLYHTELMSPGSRQFSFRFAVPYKKKNWQFSRQILYPIGTVNIFVSNPELTIEGAGIQAMGDFGIRGTNYQRYSVAHLIPGMELVLTAKNLPAKSFALSTQWLVLIAVIILLIVGFGYTMRKSKS